MPQYNPATEQFFNDIESLLQGLIDRLKEGNLSEVDLARLTSEIDFFEELRKEGLDGIVDKYFNGYDDIIADKIREAQRLGVRNLVSVNIDALEQLRELDTELFLRSAQGWSAQYKSELLKSIIRGDTIPETIKNLEGIPLTNAQLGTVLNTNYADMSRIATKEIYKDEPERRFKYVGGIIPTSSEQCRWLMLNQKPEGYTSKEIEAGIETPFKHKYTDRFGQYKAGDVEIINWQGRVPNFNCIHTFEVLE